MLAGGADRRRRWSIIPTVLVFREMGFLGMYRDHRGCRTPPWVDFQSPVTLERRRCRSQTLRFRVAFDEIFPTPPPLQHCQSLVGGVTHIQRREGACFFFSFPKRAKWGACRRKMGFASNPFESLSLRQHIYVRAYIHTYNLLGNRATKCETLKRSTGVGVKSSRCGKKIKKAFLTERQRPGTGSHGKPAHTYIYVVYTCTSKQLARSGTVAEEDRGGPMRIQRGLINSFTQYCPYPPSCPVPPCQNQRGARTSFERSSETAKRSEPVLIQCIDPKEKKKAEGQRGESKSESERREGARNCPIATPAKTGAWMRQRAARCLPQTR